jgi:predicted nucleic acid-binding protein
VKAFFDTNVLVYTATSDNKKPLAINCIALGGVASIQVLNKFVHVARRKLHRDWSQIEQALGLFRALLDDVLSLTLDTHSRAVVLARDHNLAFYDALIVAAAIEAGCDTLFSEDLQHGRRFDGLVVVNPFLQSAP